jgi:hypothetical protein
MKNNILINEYYSSNADRIYGMMRKTFIYITKINKKTFNYVIVDWRARTSIESGIEMFEIYIHFPIKRRGKLEHSEYFSHINRKRIIENIK